MTTVENVLLVFLIPEVRSVPHAANSATNTSVTIRVTRRDILISKQNWWCIKMLR